MANDENVDPWIGKYVLVRCKDAGVHAGFLKSRTDRSCELGQSRRLWYWKVADGGAFLSGIATLGLDIESQIGAPVDIILTENCEIIGCSNNAATNIQQMQTYVAK